MAIPQWLTVVSHSLRITCFNAPRLLHTLLLGLLLFTGIGLSPINQAFADNRLIILVRHAEKAEAPAGDPTLSDDGHARAIALVSALQRTQISQLIATQYQRTQQTLLPMSSERHLPITVVAAEKPLEAHIQQIVEQVHAVKGNSLIAGHSNTVPLIIKALGGPDIPTIAEDDYSQLFLLSIHDGQPASLISTRYGHK
ncbi:histidine phosphatase family protein [Shewanella sp. Koi 1]